MLPQLKGNFIMMNLEKIIAECEKNSIPDNEIDFSDIPEITDFTGFKPRYPEYFKPKRKESKFQLG